MITFATQRIRVELVLNKDCASQASCGLYRVLIWKVRTQGPRKATALASPTCALYPRQRLEQMPLAAALFLTSFREVIYGQLL